MKNLTICSKERMDINKCYEAVKTYQSKAIKGEDQISFGKYPNSICIYFPSISNENEEEKKDMDFVEEKVPFDIIWFTHIDFHTIAAVKRLISVLSNIDAELYIADENENTYTLNEYLQNAVEY